MDRIENPPRRQPEPSQPARPRRASPWIFLLVLGGVGLFALLLGPVMKPRPAAPRVLVGGGTGGELQPSWQRTRAAAQAQGSDAGAR
jgi:hypothetical protein